MVADTRVVGSGGGLAMDDNIFGRNCISNFRDGAAIHSFFVHVPDIRSWRSARS